MKSLNMKKYIMIAEEVKCLFLGRRVYSGSPLLRMTLSCCPSQEHELQIEDLG